MIKLRELCYPLALGLMLSALACPAQGENKDPFDKSVCRDLKGDKRWEAVMFLTPQGEQGKYLFTEEGSGVYFGFDVPIRWKTRVEFSDDGKSIVPIRMNKVFTSESGDTLFEGSQEFDAAENKVTCVKRWPKSGKEVRKTFEYDGDIVNDSLLGLYTRRFLKGGERVKSFYLVTNDPDIYKITAKVVGEEDITVNGVEMRSYKISLKPGGLIGMFAPETYVWHLAGGGFDWLKYKGAEDTIDSPVVIMETLKPVLKTQ